MTLWSLLPNLGFWLKFLTWESALSASSETLSVDHYMMQGKAGFILTRFTEIATQRCRSVSQSGRGKGTGIGCVKSALGNLPLPQMRHSLWKCTWVVTCHRVTHFLGSRDRLMVQLLWQIWLQAGLLKGSMDLRGSVLEEFPSLLARVFSIAL